MEQKQALSLLIVDDEPIMREGLKVYIDWRNCGIESICTAGDGVSALEVVQSQRPDILITDIRMPEMTGLELIEEVRKLQPDCVCLIISGYNDFEYAKKGIEMGAFGYLVKPVSEEELKNAAVSAAQEAHRRIESHQMLERYQEASGQQQRLKDRELLNELLSGEEVQMTPALEAAGERMGISFHRSAYTASVTRLTGKPAPAGARAAELFTVAEERLRQKLPESVELCCLTGKNSLVVVTGADGVRELDRLMEETFRAVFDAAAGCFSLPQVTAVGGKVSNPGDLFLSRSEAEQLCLYKAFFQETGVFRGRRESGELPEKPFLWSEEEKRHFLKLLEENDITAMAGELHALQQAARELGCQDKNVLFSILLELMLSAVRLLDAKKIRLEQFINIELFTSAFLDTFESADQLFEWLSGFFTILSNAYSDRSNTELENRLTEQIKRYIRDNLNENINLARVAEYFHYNSNYLGRLFKKNAGMKFSDYLNDLRIEQTCHLLSSTDLSVEEIAYRTGYCDCQYFIKVFKSRVGTTPRKYRTEAGRAV